MRTQDPVIFQIKRENIFQHARHLFATNGYAETSMDNIAQVCHMQKPSLYHYFSSKQQLLQDLIDWECARMADRLKFFETGKDLRETLHRVATTILSDLEDTGRREFFTLIHFESHKNPSILRALRDSPTHNRKGFYAVFEKHLKIILTEDRIPLFITQFMGALLHYAINGKLRGENMCFAPLNDKAYVEQLVDLFVRGLGVV